MNKWQQYFKKSKFASLYHKNLDSREKLNSSGKFFLLKENEDDKVIFFPPFSTQRNLTRGLMEMVCSEHPHKQGPALRC